MAADLRKENWYHKRFWKSEEDVLEKPELFRYNEKARIAFMNDPNADIAAMMDQMKQEAETGVLPGNSPEKAVATARNREDQFDIYRRNPTSIPFNSVDEKLSFLIEEFTAIYNAAPDDAEKEQLRKEIDSE